MGELSGEASSLVFSSALLGASSRVCGVWCSAGSLAGGALDNSPVPGASTFFFPLWRGRKCTRLGPYNCVSSENLSEKDPHGPNMANLFTTKQKTENNHSDPQIPQPDLRFAANPPAKQQRNGAGPNKNTHNDGLPGRCCCLSTASNQKHANELPCGRSAVKRSATANKIQ